MENLSHSRQPSKFSHSTVTKRAGNGSSFAGKNAYDDVFGGPPRFGATSLSPRPEDYSEIFGGFHNSRATSIPVLDLPLVDDEGRFFDVRSSGFDYGEVFGGFGGLDFAASFEELVRQANCGDDRDCDGDSSEEAWTPAETERLSEESDHSEKDQYSSNGDSYEPIDSNMEFSISYHKTNHNGITRVAELHSFPEYAHVYEETIPLDKAHGQSSQVRVTGGDVNLQSSAGRTREKHLSKMFHSFNGTVDEVKATDDLESRRQYERNGSYSDQMFFTISEISLRTQPSQLPPPTRPPPMLDVNKGDCREGQTTAPDKRVGDNSPPYFDVEIDASSAAAVSAAAMKEVMENAQEKLKIAKELLERKRDGVQTHKRVASKYGGMDKKEKDSKTVDDSCDMDDEPLQRACEKGKSEQRNSLTEDGRTAVKTTRTLPGSIEGEKHFNATKSYTEEKHASKFRSPKGSYNINGADEWQEAAQFFELVRTDKLVFEQVSKESHLLPTSKIHEPQQKAERAATEALKQQREIDEEVTIVREDQDLEKIERDLRSAKEAYWRPETNGRSEAEKQAVQFKVNEKKFEAPQDVSKLEENAKKSRTTHHRSERGKKIPEAHEPEKHGRIETRVAENELEIEQVRTCNANDDSKFQQKHNKIGEMLERGNEGKYGQACEQSENEKMLRKCLEQEEKERRLKEVRRREEKKKKEKGAREREEKAQKEREAHYQEEKEEKEREAREREEKGKREREAVEREKKEKKEQEAHEVEEKENERELRKRQEQEKKETEARKREEEKRKREALKQEEKERKEMEARKIEEEEKRNREALIQEEQKRKERETCKQEEGEKRKREALKQEERERKKGEAHKQEEEKKERDRYEQEEYDRKQREASEQQENERKEKELRELEESERIWRMALEQLENEKRLMQTFWHSETEGKTIKAPEQEELEVKQKEDYEKEEKDRRPRQTTEQVKNEKQQKEPDKVEGTETRHKRAHEKETNNVLEAACEGEETGRRHTKFHEEGIEKMVVIDDKHLRPKEALDGEGEKKSEEAFIHEEMKEVKSVNDAYYDFQREHIGQNLKIAEGNDLQLEEKGLEVPAEALGQDTNRKSQDNNAWFQCEANTEKKFVRDDIGIEQRSSEKITSTSRVYCDLENQEGKFMNEHRGRGKNIKEVDTAANQLGNLDKFFSTQALKKSVEIGRTEEIAQSFISEGKINTQKIPLQVKTSQTIEKDNNISEIRAAEEKEAGRIKRERELEMERLRKIEEEREREREREKDRMAVDRMTLEARDRPYAESRERAERAAMERANAEARHRTLAEARERLDKACSEARERSYTEARLRADRTAVARATAEARERAAEKAMAERAAADTRERIERSISDKYSSSRNNEMRASSSLSELKDHQFQRAESFGGSRFPLSFPYNGVEGESVQRCKARLERYRRTAERAAKALEEKNMRDLLAQREQAERHRLAETLDADVKRWSSGKEGNLRALLSTLQYILGQDSGWQPIPLTEVITSAAVKKAYRKATLCVHPDKLQQRGASIQQKYICEKVFDLLKEAWNKFNSEER